MSTLKTGALRGTSGTADSIQLHASNQSVTFPGDVTCSGTSTGFGAPNIGADERQGYSGLKVTNAASNSATTITCDSALLENSSGVVLKVSSVSVTLNCTTTGANGLDTGSLAASKYYYVYIISNGSTTASLASLSKSPTMPSGYTYKARVSSIGSDASSNLIRCQTNNNRVDFQIPSLVLGSGGDDYLSSTKIAVPWCPPTATSFGLHLSTSGGTDTTGCTHQWQIAGDASGNYSFEFGRWWSLGDDNRMGDIRNSFFGPIPVVTVESDIVQCWVRTWTNSGPNWTLSYKGHTY